MDQATIAPPPGPIGCRDAAAAMSTAAIAAMSVVPQLQPSDDPIENAKQVLKALKCVASSSKQVGDMLRRRRARLAARRQAAADETELLRAHVVQHVLAQRARAAQLQQLQDDLQQAQALGQPELVKDLADELRALRREEQRAAQLLHNLKRTLRSRVRAQRALAPQLRAADDALGVFSCKHSLIQAVVATCSRTTFLSAAELGYEEEGYDEDAAAEDETEAAASESDYDLSDFPEASDLDMDVDLAQQGEGDYPKLRVARPEDDKDEVGELSSVSAWSFDSDSQASSSVKDSRRRSVSFGPLPLAGLDEEDVEMQEPMTLEELSDGGDEAAPASEAPSDWCGGVCAVVKISLSTLVSAWQSHCAESKASYLNTEESNPTKPLLQDIKVLRKKWNWTAAVDEVNYLGIPGACGIEIHHVLDVKSPLELPLGGGAPIGLFGVAKSEPLVLVVNAPNALELTAQVSYPPFLKKAIEIANVMMTHDRCFERELDADNTTKRNPRDVEVRFQRPQIGSIYGWTDRSAKAKAIFVNEVLLHRMEMIDQAENSHEYQCIVFMVAATIFHECAHLTLRWKKILDSPGKFQFEAGTYMETALFKGTCRLRIQQSNRALSKRSKRSGGTWTKEMPFWMW
ncbi:unnamed protein product [Phytophthora lilii]|uniref:Unnamed protein product n=1 Tax=Phytophthora lilii TaxID=2077276 RepID=A0A9W7CQ66_9STRA|nr:unnamed protein product [Phytophthora lilii]